MERASSSISSVISTPMALPVGPTRRAEISTSAPAPQPRSSTVSPARNSATAVGTPHPRDATLGLLLVIFALAHTRRASSAPAAVGAYIGAAYFFTSSSSFANPAIAVGRMFSDTFAGIAPASVPGYVLAQLAGAIARRSCCAPSTRASSQPTPPRSSSPTPTEVR